MAQPPAGKRQLPKIRPNNRTLRLTPHKDIYDRFIAAKPKGVTHTAAFSFMVDHHCPKVEGQE